MENIVEELSSPVWWVTVVIAGFLINVIAAFVFKKLDNSFSNFSSRFREMSEQRRSERDQRVEHLRNDYKSLYLISLDEIRYRLRMVQGVVLGVFIFVFVEFASVRLNIPDIFAVFFLFFSVLSIFVGWISHGKSMSLLSEIFDSQKQR